MMCKIREREKENRREGELNKTKEERKYEEIEIKTLQGKVICEK